MLHIMQGGSRILLPTHCMYLPIHWNPHQGNYKDNLKDLLALQNQDVITSDRYVHMYDPAIRSAWRGIVEAYIRDYPNTAFLALVHMLSSAAQVSAMSCDESLVDRILPVLRKLAKKSPSQSL